MACRHCRTMEIAERNDQTKIVEGTLIITIAQPSQPMLLSVDVQMHVEYKAGQILGGALQREPRLGCGVGSHQRMAVNNGFKARSSVVLLDDRNIELLLVEEARVLWG